MNEKKLYRSLYAISFDFYHFFFVWEKKAENSSDHIDT